MHDILHITSGRSLSIREQKASRSSKKTKFAGNMITLRNVRILNFVKKASELPKKNFLKLQVT